MQMRLSSKPVLKLWTEIFFAYLIKFINETNRDSHLVAQQMPRIGTSWSLHQIETYFTHVITHWNDEKRCRRLRRRGRRKKKRNPGKNSEGNYYFRLSLSKMPVRSHVVWMVLWIMDQTCKKLCLGHTSCIIHECVFRTSQKNITISGYRHVKCNWWNSIFSSFPLYFWIFFKQTEVPIVTCI